ncbi:ribonuclease Z [Salinactinospora qingdaonensis]|uniref:Ribonuclease Z n=2 Tax=Salinactinospora qingdaonensis TaxID=702744 RepID=A0ABP7GL37_9ACTN
MRELVVLGTSSAVPTKRRNHNGYFLRFDGEGVVVDPGEGTQRQMRLAGVSAHDVTRVCVTHFHGDHCLGLPGVVQWMARDGVEREVPVVFPAAGYRYWERLRAASWAVPAARVVAVPVAGEQSWVGAATGLAVQALPLQHRVPTYGYRLVEPDGVRMVPELLERHGVGGPTVGRLQRQGWVVNEVGQRVELAQVSRPRPGQVVAFVMDTEVCDNAVRLARAADLLVIESTFLRSEEALARRYGHLTAEQAGQIAAAAGVRRVVLTHFSERYGDGDDARFAEEAARAFGGDIVVAADLDRVALPRRR